MPLHLLLACILFCITPATYAATQVLPLHYRTSADILPIAQQLVGREGSVAAYGNQLVVNADPDKLDELTALLEQLDKPARRLMISVDTSDSNTANQRGYRANGGGTTRIIQYGTDNRSGGVQQVQASEGSPALIQVGQSVPLTSAGTDAYGRLQAQTEYRDVTQGFYVTASLTGDVVHLNIATNNDRLSQERADVVNVQNTQATLSGRLGEWITVAGMNEHSSINQQGLARQYSTQGRNDMTVRVKVDVLD
jgi:hypothetical protein